MAARLALIALALALPPLAAQAPEASEALGPGACSDCLEGFSDATALLQTARQPRVRQGARAKEAAAAAAAPPTPSTVLTVPTFRTSHGVSSGESVRLTQQQADTKQTSNNPQDDFKIDVNGRVCNLCWTPLPERVDRVYVERSDCGNQSIWDNPEKKYVPIATFSREASGTHNETNGWCELNLQKMCADALYNKDFLYQAKAVDYPRDQQYDPVYCHINGWLAPEIVALQHDFEGMKAKAAEVCASPRYLSLGWNSTMTVADFSKRFDAAMERGQPTEEEATFAGAWTCAMGSAGCDMAYCAYSFCYMPDGSLGRYEECEGWDPVHGMPVPGSKR